MAVTRVRPTDGDAEFFVGRANAETKQPEAKKPEAKPAAPETQQPTRKLPTDRIAFQKQLDILRAYGLASAGGTKAVHYSAAAEVVKMSANTVSLMNTFMIDNGFVQKSGNDFIPDKSLIEFAQAYSWNPDTAPKKLAPLIRRTWFGEVMLMRLQFRAMSTDDMVSDLAGQVAAAPEFKSQIETLIDYGVTAGLVRRDGTQLSLGDVSDAPAPEPPRPTTENAMSQQPETRSDPPARTPGAVGTGFMSTEGGVQFHVAIKVDMQEMAGWSPDRIAAFFSGLAQVLAAKKGTEQV